MGTPNDNDGERNRGQYTNSNLSKKLLKHCTITSGYLHEKNQYDKPFSFQQMQKFYDT